MHCVVENVSIKVDGQTKAWNSFEHYARKNKYEADNSTDRQKSHLFLHGEICC